MLARCLGALYTLDYIFGIIGHFLGNNIGRAAGYAGVDRDMPRVPAHDLNH
jgi:hypothetical protein